MTESVFTAACQVIRLSELTSHLLMRRTASHQVNISFERKATDTIGGFLESLEARLMASSLALRSWHYQIIRATGLGLENSQVPSFFSSAHLVGRLGLSRRVACAHLTFRRSLQMLLKGLLQAKRCVAIVLLASLPQCLELVWLALDTTQQLDNSTLSLAPTSSLMWAA
eukprot:402770-Amphidinium_carterae.1